MICAGIDIGSNTAKAALTDGNKILGTRIAATGFDPVNAANKVLDAVLKETGLSRDDIAAVVSTGYGRAIVRFADRAVTEIIAHAAGAHFIDPSVRGVVDVGGQDSKAIRLEKNGTVRDFAMNDKCAAGTGRFLEVMANALEVGLDELGDFALAAVSPAKISSICTVFAESEVISMIAKEEKRENIIAGIHESAAARVAILARKVKIEPPVMMTGGVALNKGMVNALEKQLDTRLLISDMPQENGAVGAAVLASRL